jgi:aryl-alcohol dehydrogenase-like predicted oxidoreductase
MTDFTHTTLRPLQKKVHRLGLALNYGIEERGVTEAFERGVNYVFFQRSGTSKTLAALRAALQKDRERIVIATGPSLGFFGGSVRRGCERALKRLGTDYIDVFQLYWLSKMSAWTPQTIEALVKLKEEGKVRSIGISIHDRPRAGRLAEDSPLDLFMIRYNAAHPGAEKDIFPHLARRQPSIIAYTATAWRKLLKPPKAWKGPTMTAGDCYRFCLSNPNVDVVLTGPASGAQLDENLRALEKGPLSEADLSWMREYGRLVHG